MMDRRNFLQMTTGSALSSMLMLNGCWNPFSNNQNQEETPNSQENGVLRLAITTHPNTFDPALSSSQIEYSVAHLIFNGLVRLDEDIKPYPDLAESWEHTDDHLNWTFKLRQNAKFHHNSVSLTAEDVVHTFKHIRDDNTRSPLGFILNSLESIEGLDKYTVRFTFKTPNIDFLFLLSEPQAKIISKEHTPDSLDRKPSGTGPFKFDRYIQGEPLVLRQNKEYWDSTLSSNISTIEYHFVPLSRQVKMLTDNEVNVIPHINSSQLEDLIDHPEIDIIEIPNAAYTPIIMRVTEPPFDNPSVREALKCCIERQTLLDQSYTLNEKGNDHPIASIFGDYRNNLPLRPYDPDKARDLLEQAGYSDGLTLDLITSEVAPEMVWLAERFSEMAAEAGVTINVIPVSSDIYWSDYWNQHSHFFMGNWPFRPSISATLMLPYHSESPWNEGKWHVPALDELLNSAQAELDEDRRIELYHKVQKLIYDEGPVIIPCFRNLIMAKHKSVQGLKPHRKSRINLKTLRRVAEED